MGERKLSAVICAYGETLEDVAMTVDSILACKDEVEALEVFVADDNGDGLNRYGSLSDRCRVVCNDRPLGRGITANKVFELTQYHPVFPDAHMRLPKGTLGQFADVLQNRAFACAGVSGLGTGGCQGWGASFRFHRGSGRGRLGTKFFTPPRDPKTKQYIIPPDPMKVMQPFGGCYGFNREAFQYIGGWTDIGERWGYCEQPIGYMAWACDIPIYAIPAIIEHRFRKVNPSGAGDREIWVNVAAAHIIMCQPATWQHYWRKIVLRHLNEGVVAALEARPDIAQRHKDFQQRRHPNHTDAAFFREVLGVQCIADASGAVLEAATASIVLPCNNEGDEVVATTDSIRAASHLEPEIIHVDDASTDNCCRREQDAKGRYTRLDPAECRILRNPVRMGVTRSRLIGQAKANEWIHGFMDDHSRCGKGDIDRLIEAAAETKGIIVGTVHHFRDPKEVHADPKQRCYGSRWCIKPKWGLRGAYNMERPTENVNRINMAMGSVYFGKREVWQMVRSWTPLPGLWAYSEQALALKCWALDVPLYNLRDALIWHRVKDMANCDQQSVALNAHFIHRAYFDEDTYTDIWRPIIKEMGDFPAIDEMLRNDPVLKDEIAWYQANRRHTDEEFFGMLASKPEELLKVDLKAGTAIPQTQAGYIAYEARRSPGREWHADRPRMEKRHIPALLKELHTEKPADAPEPLGERLHRARKWGAATKQDGREFAEAYKVIAERRPAVFVEIGSYRGGSLYGYAGACEPGATIIAIDSGASISEPALTATIDRLNAEGYEAVWVRGNSSDPATLDQVKRILGDEKIGAIHVDGDHMTAAVLADYETYRPLMAEDGLMLFHDIVRMRHNCEVPVAWAELKQHGETKEWTFSHEHPKHESGIGCLFVGKPVQQNGVANLKLLDIGSRDGWILDKLVSCGFTKENLVGLEISPWAAKNARAHGRNVLTGDAHDLSRFPDAGFDVVVAIHSLEHTHAPEKVLEGIKRVLKPGGLLMAVAPIEVVGAGIRGDHCHVMRNPEAFKKLIAAAGFAVGAESIHPAREPELTVFARKPA